MDEVLEHALVKPKKKPRRKSTKKEDK